MKHRACWVFAFARRMSLGILMVLASASAAWAQDALRGAGLYVQLPAVASCVSCHGPDPAANRNNLLRAGDQPAILLKALNAVGVMGYLKGELSDDDIADLSAYLGAVTRAASDTSRSVWPRTIEFGSLSVGAASPEHAVWLRNLSGSPLSDVVPRVAGGRFDLRHDCPTTLAPGAACTASVRALATSAGLAWSDAVVWGSTGFAVTGLSARATDAPVARLQADTASVELGNAEVGSLVTRRVTLLNAGTAAATLGVSTLTGPTAFAFSTDSGCAANTVLLPGTGCVVELRFRPNALLGYEGSLQWRSDGGNPAPVRLQATGVAAATPPSPSPSPSPSGLPASPPAASNDDRGGGGCSAAPTGAGGDSALLLWIALAALMLLGRPTHRD